MVNMLEIFDEITLLHEQAERASMLQREVNVDFLQPIDSKKIVARDGFSRIDSEVDIHIAAIKGAIVEDILDDIVTKLAALYAPLKEYIAAETPVETHEARDEHSKALFEALHQLHARNLAHEYIRQLNAIAWHMVNGDKITVNVDITTPAADK